MRERVSGPNGPLAANEKAPAAMQALFHFAGILLSNHGNGFVVAAMPNNGANFNLVIEIDILLCIGQQRCVGVGALSAKEAGQYTGLLPQTLQLDVIQLDLLG